MSWKNFNSFFLIISLFSFLQVFCQTKDTSNVAVDSLNYKSEVRVDSQKDIKLNWQTLNNPSLYFQKKYNLFTLFEFMELSQFYYLSPIENNELDYYKVREELLSNFRSINNWEVKKKYGVFAKYLSYAQFLGALGLAVIHLNKWNDIDKEKNVNPKKKFNRY
ncbi:MAG: hypothetical protein KAQ90_01865 [Melioribacteraceae bacterium]|nr:hypothetical protein [Melioribacteraceae bacterium]